MNPAPLAHAQVAGCEDPFKAARMLVNTAYKTWLQRETRTDDITAIVIFIDGGGA